MVPKSGSAPDHPALQTGASTKLASWAIRLVAIRLDTAAVIYHLPWKSKHYFWNYNKLFSHGRENWFP